MNKLEQSYGNLCIALDNLKDAVSTPPVESRDFGGIIKAFESTYELLWKTLKLILEKNGLQASFPRLLVFEEAFKAQLIVGNEIWKEMMEDRNLAVHTYDRNMAVRLCQKITQAYAPLMVQTVRALKPHAL